MQFIGVNENIKHASERNERPNTKDLNNKLVLVLGVEHV